MRRCKYYIPQKIFLSSRGRLWFLCFFIPILLLGTAACAGEEPQVLLEEAKDSGNIGVEDTGEPVQTTESAKGDPAQEVIWVDICGEVKVPGVYAMDQGDRLYQLVEKAGGFTEDAASASVNQARVLSDGEQIRVLSLEEASAGLGEASQAAAEVQGKIDLNTAGEEELTKLNGIGPSKAAAIVAYREEHGRFASIEEITEVEGIGDGTFAKIKEDIVVS
ncbi:MAG: helix-hairpin-helix domain-containing protein [Blautia sp.]|jgi:competence protein ComEA